MQSIIFMLITCFLIEANLLALPSDSIKKPFSLGGNLHYGVILPHSELIRPLAFTHPYGLELNFNWLNYSENSVKQLNCYSYTGLAINYIDFGHPKIGNTLYAWFYFEPLIRFRHKLGYGIRAGFGVSYLSTVYDEKTNPENKFFASHIAFLLVVDFKIKYKISKKIELTTSACYNHISNGGFKQPNYGMNFPTVTLGINYHFKLIDLQPINKEKINAAEKVWKLKAEVLTSIKVQNKTSEFNEKACFAYGFSAFTNKRLAKFSSINLGCEFIADGYVQEGIKRAGLETDYKRAAVFAGHELIFGKVNFTINFGAYFYCPFKAKDPIYQKYMLQYSFNKHLYSGIYMLAHGDAAEIMGFNLGYAFKL